MTFITGTENRGSSHPPTRAELAIESERAQFLSHLQTTGEKLFSNYTRRDEAKKPEDFHTLTAEFNEKLKPDLERARGMRKRLNGESNITLREYSEDKLPQISNDLSEAELLEAKRRLLVTYTTAFLDNYSANLEEKVFKKLKLVDLALQGIHVEDSEPKQATRTVIHHEPIKAPQTPETPGTEKVREQLIQLGEAKFAYDALKAEDGKKAAEFHTTTMQPLLDELQKLGRNFDLQTLKRLIGTSGNNDVPEVPSAPLQASFAQRLEENLKALYGAISIDGLHIFASVEKIQQRLNQLEVYKKNGRIMSDEEYPGPLAFQHFAETYQKLWGNKRQLQPEEQKKLVRYIEQYGFLLTPNGRIVRKGNISEAMLHSFSQGNDTISIPDSTPPIEYDDETQMVFIQFPFDTNGSPIEITPRQQPVTFAEINGSFKITTESYARIKNAHVPLDGKIEIEALPNSTILIDTATRGKNTTIKASLSHATLMIPFDSAPLDTIITTSGESNVVFIEKQSGNLWTLPIPAHTPPTPLKEILGSNMRSLRLTATTETLQMDNAIEAIQKGIATTSQFARDTQNQLEDMRRSHPQLRNDDFMFFNEKLYERVLDLQQMLFLLSQMPSTKTPDQEERARKLEKDILSAKQTVRDLTAMNNREVVINTSMREKYEDIDALQHQKAEEELRLYTYRYYLQELQDKKRAILTAAKPEDFFAYPKPQP